MTDIIVPATPEDTLTMHRIYIAAFERLERQHAECVDRLASDVAKLKKDMEDLYRRTHNGMPLSTSPHYPDNIR